MNNLVLILLLTVQLTLVGCLEDKEVSASVKVSPKDSVQSGDDESEGDDSVEENTNTTVSSPSSITMVSPSTTSGINATPTVAVGGVEIGATVKLYKDSSCTNQIGSEQASSSSVEITTSTLSSGAHSFYATSTLDGVSSNCSSASVTYTKNDCPTGYIPVPGNTYLGTNDFCVMKFEAKNVGGVPTSQAALSSWNNIQLGPAKTNCMNLSASNGSFDLISNREWLTIAYNIEQVDSNWSGGSVGNGEIARGHSDRVWSTHSVLAVTDESDPYNGTGNSSTSGWNQKRTHTLSNGEVIWDLAGNIWEWVDWTENGELKTVNGHTFSVPLNPGCSISSWTEIATGISSCSGVPSIEIEPFYNANNNPDLGRADGFGGFVNNIQSSGQFTGIRGGASYNGTSTGIYAISFGNSYTNTSVGYGHRCVYRP